MLAKILQWDRETFVYPNSLGIEQYNIFWSTATKFPFWIPLLCNNLSCSVSKETLFHPT
jgi:hypothetical protein